MKSVAVLTAVLAAISGCDPSSCAYQPDGTCTAVTPAAPVVMPVPDPEPPAEPAPVGGPAVPGYPWIRFVRTAAVQWSLACDMPAEMADTVREAAGWWTTIFVKGILAPESPCDTFADVNSPGLQITFQPDSSPYGGFGGMNPATGHAFVLIAKGHYSRLVLGIVVMHELGHALGLDHVDEPGCIMYRGAAKDHGTGLCQLEQAGLAAAYPRGF